MLKKLISIYILIASGTAFGQDPVVIKVGENKEEPEVNSNVSEPSSGFVNVFLLAGADISAAEYQENFGTFSSSDLEIGAGFEVCFPGFRSGAAFDHGWNFELVYGIPFSKELVKRELKLRNTYNFIEKPIASGTFTLGIKTGYNLIQFQDQKKLKDSEGYLDLGFEFAYHLNDKIFFTLAPKYSHVRDPLLLKGLESNVSIDFGVRYLVFSKR